MFNPAISQRNKELWSLIYTCKRWDLITQHSAIEYRFTKILNKVFTQLKYIIWDFYQVTYTSELWTNSHPSTMWTLSLPWRLTWPGEGLPSCPSTRIRSLAGSLQIPTDKTKFNWFYMILFHFTTIYCIYISFKSIVKPAEFKLGIILLNFWIFYNTREKTLTEINSDRSTKLQSLVLIQLPSGFG